MHIFFFFFFQAEDGIRDWSVTGVQTCALPISLVVVCLFSLSNQLQRSVHLILQALDNQQKILQEHLDQISETGQSERTWERSEERRVGKECRSRRSRFH